MNESSDRDLQDLFRRLRDAESGLAPHYGVLLKRRRRMGVRRPAGRLALAAAAAAFIAVVAIYSTRSGRVGNSHFATLAWRSPTDFLLDTPGHDLLSSVPTLATGAAPAASPEWRNQP